MTLSPKLVAVLNGGIAQFDIDGAAGLEGLLEQKRLERGVELLSNVLEQHRLTELDGVLQHSHVVRLRQPDDVQSRRPFEILDPLVRLALRIDHQRPAPRVPHDYPILHGEEIARQTEDAPGADEHRIAEHVCQLVIWRADDAEVRAHGHPMLELLLPIGSRKDAEIRDDARADEHVARQLVVALAER